MYMYTEPTVSVLMSEIHFLINVITVSFSVPILHLTVHRFGSLWQPGHVTIT